MKLTTRARYGLRALLDIACHSQEGPVRLGDVARRQGLSEPYLEQLILILRKAGLVRSVRGARGGFVLGRPASEITLDAVVGVLEGEINLTDCLATRSVCQRSEECTTRELWFEINEVINRLLSSKTLQDLVDRQLSRQTSH